MRRRALIILAIIIVVAIFIIILISVNGLAPGAGYGWKRLASMGGFMEVMHPEAHAVLWPADRLSG
jgi:ABC-type antimicrobial peptide transport system permease subunit